jgi:hypothetical protein
VPNECKQRFLLMPGLAPHLAFFLDWQDSILPERRWEKGNIEANAIKF